MMQGWRVSVVRVSLALCATTVALGGFAACGEDESDSGSVLTTQAQQAAARLQQFAAEQQRQIQQAARATSYGQSASIHQDYVATQQQAEQELRALRSDQALGDFYAARTRSNEEYTEMLREQMERAAETQRRHEEQRRYEELLEQQRLENERYEEQLEQSDDDPY